MYLLSVIIPVFNAAPFLEQCLCSIMNAAGNRSERIEIILVNDGSTDNSGEICNRFSEKNANIRCFHQENRGVASARNVGLQYARGRYIAWVDPDDYVAGNWFFCIEEAIRDAEPDVIVMDMVRFGPDGEKSEIYGREKGFVPRDVFVEDVIRDVRILSGLPNKVMKAELFRDVRFNESLPILEDFAALPDILEKACSVYYLGEPLYYYRQHEESLLHHVTAERAFLSVKVALERGERVEEKFRAAAVIAAAWQMFLFCRSDCLDPAFRAEKSQTRFCRRYIRRHIRTICKDAELTKMQKLKMFLLGIGVYGLIARI